MNGTIVAQLMATPVETVSEDAPIRDAAARMFDARVGSLVVVAGDAATANTDTETAADDVVGILTATDVVGIVADGTDAGDGTVAGYMTPDPVTIGPDVSIRSAADRMLEHGVHHVPVLEDDALVGVITTTDLTAFLSTTRPPSP
jgi:CBS domain-containing protein